MRYIIDTNDEEGIIGMQISKWEKEKKLSVIEKGQPIIELQAHLERIGKALEILKKAGYNSQVMRSFIYEQTHISKAEINSLLQSQEDFFKQIGVLPKSSK
jgi:hypothetical protein